MAENALARKLKLKPGARAAVIGAPPGYLAELQPLPQAVSLATSLRGALDWVQLFVTTKSELAGIIRKAAAALKPESLLWISFPKGSSGIQTDLSRDKGWEPLEGTELKWVTLVSVNDTWSAFALRPYRPGEPRQKGRYAPTD
jgi:hypothetical protein